MKRTYFNKLFILSCLVLAIISLACNQAKYDTLSTQQVEISLPDSIIDAGIVKYSLHTSRDNKKKPYFSKAVEAHEYYNLLPVINDDPNKEKLDSHYSEAIYNYSLSLEKKEFLHREHVVLQNRAALKMKFGDYHGAISDYTALLNMQTFNEQEYQVLQAYCYLKVGDINKSELIIDNILKGHPHKEIKTESIEMEESKVGAVFKADLPDRAVDYTFLSSAFYYKGIIDYLKGNKIVACQSWSKSTELNEDIAKYAALTAIQKYCK